MLLALLTLAFPASAAAQVPTPTPTPPPPAPTPTPTPPPAPQATATLALGAQGVYGGRARIGLRGRAFTVRGVVTPFVAGQAFVVRAYRGKRKILARAAAPVPVNGGTAGVFAVAVKSGRPGPLRITASHAATPQLAAVKAKALRVHVVTPSAALGARGPVVRLLQARLAGLHYSVPRTGVYDAGTARAVLAWRKMTGMARTTVATEAVFDGLLDGHGRFHVRHPGDGHHVEARLDKQVLALIDRGKVFRIYHISSGKPSTPTVRGRFKVYMKQPGTNSHGMVDSSYFIRGYAIHGYYDVPAYNASHGCLRVPIPNARAIYDWVRIGDVVWVE